jgi:hypothetical protein
MTADDFRHIALSMPGAMEGAHMGHPDFRVNGRIFASLHTNDSRGMVSLAADEQEQLLREHQAMFVPSSGAWGRQGCTDVKLDRADARAVRGAMILAWERTAALPAPKASKTGTRKSASLHAGEARRKVASRPIAAGNRRRRPAK